MKRILARSIFLIAWLVLALNSANAETMDDVVKRGAIRIGVAAESFMPWVGRDSAGQLLGFEVDMAHELARGLGVQLELVEIPFDSLSENLGTGHIDAIMSAFSVTAQRARSVLFSNPYGETDYWLVVDGKSLPPGAQEGDYDADGYKVGVMEGTVSENLAREMFIKSEIVPLADEAAARDALSEGKINAIIAPTPYPSLMMLRNPDRFAIGSDSLFTTMQAVAARPDSMRFMNFVNAWILEIKGNGRLDEAHNYWFDSLEWESRLAGSEASENEPSVDTVPSTEN